MAGGMVTVGTNDGLNAGASSDVSGAAGAVAFGTSDAIEGVTDLCDGTKGT